MMCVHAYYVDFMCLATNYVTLCIIEKLKSAKYTTVGRFLNARVELRGFRQLAIITVERNEKVTQYTV